MEIFLDLEKTLLDDNQELNALGKIKLETLAKTNKIYILTNQTILSARKRIPCQNVIIYSVLENRFDPDIFPSKKLDKNNVNFILKNYPIYTAFTISNEETVIFNYQERLKIFYPTTYLKITQKLDFDPTSIVIVNNKDTTDLPYLKNCSQKLLGQDSRHSVILYTKEKASKEAALLQVKTMKALGIGDCLEDFEFIRHCEIKVAMQNADQELKDLCPLKTAQDNNNLGALNFIEDLLKRQPT